MLEQKKKVKKLNEYKQTKPKQLALFELVAPTVKAYSNTIELYDAIPKYIWRKEKTKENNKIAPLKRKFKHKNIHYKVTISPAWIEIKDEEDKAVFPGKREELVEDALRKLTCDGQGLFLDDSAGVVFTLYELQQELERMGHGYNKNEIKEALIICASSIMNLQADNGKSIVIMPFFETLGLQTQEDWKGCGEKTKAYVRFNSLVTKSIKEKSFRLLNYDKSMSYKRVLARWLHKRLSHNYMQASSYDHFTIKLSTIIRDSGVKQYPKISDNIRQLKEALEEMKEKEVLFMYEIQNILEGRKTINANITLVPHDSFVSEVIYSNKRDKDIRKKEIEQETKKRFKGLVAELETGFQNRGSSPNQTQNRWE